MAILPASAHDEDDHIAFLTSREGQQVAILPASAADEIDQIALRTSMGGQ